jgi:hypothetical protein
MHMSCEQPSGTRHCRGFVKGSMSADRSHAFGGSKATALGERGGGILATWPDHSLSLKRPIRRMLVFRRRGLPHDP